MPMKLRVYAAVAVVVAALSSLSCGATGRQTVEKYPPGAFALTDPADKAVAVSSLPAFAWTASPGATGYRVELKSGAATEYAKIGETALTGLKVTEPLPGGVLYSWRVVARNDEGVAIAGPFEFMTSLPAPGGFTLTSPPDNATGTPTDPLFEWQGSVAATGYAVILKRYIDASYVKVADVTTPGFQVTSSLAPGVLYVWQVTARNDAGTTTAGPYYFTTAEAIAPTPPVARAVCPSNGAADILIASSAFSPAAFATTAGAVVKWTNNDAVNHTVTASPSPSGADFDSGTIAPGGSVCFRFNTAGTYPYRCSLHPGMTGSVTAP